MKYDDASWHYGGDFPENLPDSAGATHTGMFLAWAVLSGIGGEIHASGSPDTGSPDIGSPNIGSPDIGSPDLEKLRARSITPAQFFLDACDGKLTDEDLSVEGNAFATEYFDFDRGSYLADYERALADGLPTLYHVPDTWESFDKLKPLLDRRFREWLLTR